MGYVIRHSFSGRLDGNWPSCRQELGIDPTPEKKKACPLQLPYQPGMNMKCLIIKNTDGKPLPKADDKNEGPYEVTQVYTNANGLY